MNKRLIMIVAAMAVVALTVWVLVLTSGNKEVVDSGDETSLYSYTYEQNGKSVLIKITGDFGKKSWSAESSVEEIATVSQKSNGKGSASFLVKPVSNGASDIVMTLVNEEDANKGYQIVVSVFVDSDGIIEVVDSRQVETSNQEFYGEVENCYYAVTVNGSEMLVYLMGDEDMTWYAEGDLVNSLSVSEAERQTLGDSAEEETEDAVQEDDFAIAAAADTFMVTAQSSGTGYLRFVNPHLSTALEISMTITENRIIVVLNADAVNYTSKEAAEEETALTMLETMGGEQMIPGKYEPSDYYCYFGETESGKSYTKVGMFLQIDGKNWIYELFSGLDASEVMALNTSSTTNSSITGDTKTATLMMGDGYAGAVWQTESCVCQMSSIEDTMPTADVTTKAVQAVMKELEITK